MGLDPSFQDFHEIVFFEFTLGKISPEKTNLENIFLPERDPASPLFSGKRMVIVFSLKLEEEYFNQGNP
jgi:hypothetical protein